MGTLAELWDAPTTEKKTTQDVAPKRNAFSTYVPGTQIGSEATSNLADLWEQTPATEQPKEEQQYGIVADAIKKAFEARHKFNQTVAGVGEAGLTALTGSVAAPLAAATGLVYGARGGNPEEQARNLMQQMTYQPRTAKGQEYVQSLQNAFEASKLPPVFPEAQSLVGALPNRAAVKAAIPEFTIERQNVKPVVNAIENVKPATAGSVGSAKVEFNPYAGQITGEESARGQFPQVKLSKTTEDVKPQEQITRATIAKEILQEGGVDSSQVRPGVVTGNENTLRNEHTEAKSANPTPKSELLKSQIANEQIALSNYAQKRIENTGASSTLVTPYERGERINSTFTGDEGISGFIKGEKQKLYDEVATKVGGNPIQSSNVDELFGNKQFKAGLGLKGNEGVAKSAEELINLAKTVGFQDEMGHVHAPNTIGAWIAVQKALNSEWSPSNAKIIRTINQSIERDIGQAGGLEMLKKADSLHEAEKVLFGSKGIKQIFGDIDPNGVQTATAFEAIPQKLNSMPVDQWKHIYETAEKISKGALEGPIDKTTGLPKWTIPIPDELRVSAQSAVNEMRGNIAREIYQAGAAKAGEWNQNAVNKILNARADKIKLAFSPEEQKAFHTLNVGGYLMPGVHGYEGAGLQGQRVQGIIEHNLPKAGAATGATIGGAIGGPTGAAVGGYLGGKAGTTGQQMLAARHMTKEAQKLKEQMQNTSKLSDIGKEQK